MAVENADYIHQLNRDAPTGGESISDGDDHLRVIKKAVKGTFPEVKGQVTATHTELNAVGKTATDLAALTAVVDSLGGDVNDIDTNSHGNVASCYYNPTFNPKLAYAHNVADVIVDPDDPSNMQTRIVFINELDSIPNSQAAHFAFNITPVSGTGYPTLVTVSAAQKGYISFLSWHLVNGTWEGIPGTELAFSFMCNDMDKAQ